MRRYGLTGFPLSHSFSAAYFADKFAASGLKRVSYSNYPVESAAAIRELFVSDRYLMGLNVTIPYKTEVIPFLDNLDSVAAEIGAVNVIKASYEAKGVVLKGFNTDWYGFTESLPANIRNGGGMAIVLGTGGASLAVRFALNRLGFKVASVSRKSGEGIIGYNELTGSIIADAGLIVNTTPLGMYPDISGLPPLDYDSLSKETLLYDLVYNPAETLFLMEGQSRGCRIINGQKMLELQAERSWEIWTDDSF
jgi:shikimate dehydrogenase